MSNKNIPQKLLLRDAFSQWLGIEIITAETGRCKAGMTIRKEMLNGMGKAHGGITFSLADSVFAFASNTHGRLAVSIEASINHIEALEVDDYITAECTIDKVKNKVGFNVIEVRKGEELVALFKGVVYRTPNEW